MAIHNPYAAYQNNSVNTSTPGELTLMLYNGCLKFIEQAKRALENGNIEEKNTAIQKAQAIISELMVTLDTSVPVAENMMILYEFANSRLVDGNITNDAALFDEAAGIIREFRDTWKEVIQINRQKQYANVDEI
ncbi:flagellar export chaperone FliS [Sporosarcina pasteurii]|uniref:Flagellar secretion chaperone FliS n=1 Tax=Sporosarcina pasteurii TaxID=1474 RepID=A0A380BE20_SPOPA|nr:flagellar export chaperone FliS [Sporosarcina pasteurii]MDS9470335.1 flagellar export chaperone FliS [Sporosarcina pasteurii]QBQ05952.1 flagellar export chaperone FliS [Sporosarcina pasteurii]SUI99832.1 Flagellar protein fliS [Sporosarcina pasteurii]